MTDAARDLNESTAPLQRRVVLAYGIGDAGTGMASALVGFYLFAFYTAVAGLPAWLAGSVLMVDPQSPASLLAALKGLQAPKEG